MKTVEIVVEEKPWKHFIQSRDEDIVPVMVTYTEKGLRDKLKALGGKWDPEAKLWHVPYGSVRGTELEERIMPDLIKRKQGA